MAEEVGFEPTVPFGTTVFKTAAFNHSAIPPMKKSSVFKIAPKIRPQKYVGRHEAVQSLGRQEDSNTVELSMSRKALHARLIRARQMSGLG